VYEPLAHSYTLQGTVILVFHVIRSERVWSKIDRRLTTIRRKTLRSPHTSQKNEAVRYKITLGCAASIQCLRRIYVRVLDFKDGLDG